MDPGVSVSSVLVYFSNVGYGVSETSIKDHRLGVGDRPFDLGDTPNLRRENSEGWRVVNLIGIVRVGTVLRRRTWCTLGPVSSFKWVPGRGRPLSLLAPEVTNKHRQRVDCGKRYKPRQYLIYKHRGVSTEQPRD